MNLFDLLSIEYPVINPKATKIHLAIWNGKEDPFDVFLTGNFEEWQSWQTKRNFERKYIISLIQIQGNNRWLFAGGFISDGCEYIEREKFYLYNTHLIPQLEEFSGRLVVSFKRTGRASYLLAENWAESMIVEQLLPKRMVVEKFKGYNQSLISKSKLDIIVQQNIESWRSSLSNVSGVYLITDTLTGKVYVGSATGVGGIWQRWCDYSLNGHGGNKELVRILREKGDGYADNFQYSVLEIADTHTSKDEVHEREAYWKKVLCSIEHGHNEN